MSRSVCFLCVVAIYLCATWTPALAQQQLQVQWATFLGGSGRDEMRDVDCDDAENAYVCGVFRSRDFPAPRNVSGPQDANGPGYLAKFSPDGELLWLMWFQGFTPHEVAASADGYAVVGGSVDIGNNTFGGDQQGPNGSTDAGVVLVSPDGERLATTTFGGSEDDVATSVDFSGYFFEQVNQQYVYVAGITASRDIAVTNNAPQPTYGGDGAAGQSTGDGMLAKLEVRQVGGGLSLVRDILTYYGGRSLDEILCLRARGTLGELYICGRTRSDNLPGGDYISRGRPGMEFDDDGFAARLDANLRPAWRMYIGGTGNDVAYSIQPTIEINLSGGGTLVSLKICGVYNGGALITPGRQGRDSAYVGGTALGGDAFSIETSPFFSSVRSMKTINTAADDLCVAYPRRGSSSGNPLLLSNGGPGLFQPGTGFDAYFWTTQFAANRDVVYGYAGVGDEGVLDEDQQRFGFGGRAVRPGSRTRGEYFCGSTTSIGLPGTAVPGKVFQQLNGGGVDGYLVRTGCTDLLPQLIATDSILCDPSDSSVLSLSFRPLTIEWPDGSQGLSYVARSPGVVRVQYTTGIGCGPYIDSITIVRGALPAGRLGPADTLEICSSGDSVVLRLASENADSVVWSGGRSITDTTLLVTDPGTYRATLISDDGCTAVTNDVVVRLRRVDSSLRIVTSIVAPDGISPGSQFAIVLRLIGAGPLADLPEAWTATVRYDGSVLFPLFPLTIVATDGTIVSALYSGVRQFGGDTLDVLQFAAALGETDTVAFVADSIVFFPCGAYPDPVSVPLSIDGICRETGTPRFVTTQSVRLAVVSVTGGVDTPVHVVAAGTDAQHAVAQLWSLQGKRIDLLPEARNRQTVSWLGSESVPAGVYMLVVRSETDVLCYPVSVVR